MVSDKTEE
jgi:hypothetical protein